jgi:two-component system chemotaxis sensor kinase CheA
MDMLNRMVDMTAGGENVPEDMADAVKAKLTSFILKNENQDALTGPAYGVMATPGQAKSVFKILMEFRPDIMESGNDPLRLIEELCEKGQLLDVNMNIAKVSPVEELDPYVMHISWTLFMETECTYEEIRDLFVFIWDDNNIMITDLTDLSDDSGEIAEKRTGELLIDAGVIDETQLHETLKKQKKIGEILVEEAKAAPGQIEKVLEKQKTARESQQVDTIRVDTKRLENVLDFVAELVISQSRVKELVSNQNQVDVEVYNAFQEVDKIIRRLQEEVMKTSMVPVGGTFTRFQRMVRDTAAEKGKEIELIIHGQETELDKRVIEQITDPLKHMIRNSLDHGIEMPDVREAAGKPRKGTIWLNAYHQEGSIIIEVSDDGKGLDETVIRKKAIEKGLIVENQKLADHEMYKLIMMPGFSTAEQITDISGRGVGLDVVANNVRSMRGTIDLESTKGRGIKFYIKLPLTLAIIDGMMVKIGDEKFIIPLTSIVEFIKASPKDIKSVEGTGQVINMRNEYIPLAQLSRLLDIPANTDDPAEGLLVILKDARKKIALLVDDILGQEQVVTKSLKDNYQHVEGVAGATILGDGRVAVILDVPTLIRMAGR